MSQPDPPVAAAGLPGATARMMVPGPEYDRLRRWTGDWDARMRLWTSADAEVVESPPLLARRELIGDAYLQEVLQPAPGTAQDPFTRIAYLSFNNLRRRYEYVSLDSRAPGMMFETSFDDELEAPDTITVYLEGFPLAGWGPELAGTFVKQRRILTEDGPDTTICRQYWTMPASEPFLFMEYVYTRR